MITAVKSNLKKLAVITWLLILASAVTALFWYNDWVYNLPTPVPKNYHAVYQGSYINIKTALNIQNNKPIFLHFFNPDCPCSRFNVPHFKSLVRQYSNQANFAVVIMSGKKFTQQEIQEKFALHIPVLFDSAIAARCGVYSTPQAVIIDKNEKLFYRGNYNRSRYCADKKTNYAQIALDSLLQNNTSVMFSQFALKAYGCQLPKCTR